MANKHGVPVVAFERDDKLVSGSRPTARRRRGVQVGRDRRQRGGAADGEPAARCATSGASAAYAAAFDGVDASGGVRLRFDELAAQAVGRVWAAIEAVLPADADDDGAGAAHSAEAARAALDRAVASLAGARTRRAPSLEVRGRRLGAPRLFAPRERRDDAEARGGSRARLAGGGALSRER